ncbi:MAG TPA: DUF6263 family protein [Puia sp.]|nr:DUF6263 family protein [Puia sp.]
MKKSLLLLFSLTILQISFGQKQKLGFNLNIGQTYYHLMRSESNITQEISGQKNVIAATVSGRTAFKVTNKKNSIYELSVTYEQLSMSMKMSNGEINISSDKTDEKDIVSTILRTITGKPFMIRMTNTGKIIEVKNLDSVFENLFDKFPQLSLSQKQQIKEQLTKAYGEKSLKGSFEMVTAIYTDNPVVTGNSWTVTTKLESGMEANLVTTFQYKEHTDKFNLIIGKGKIKTDDKDAYIQSNGMPIKYNLTGNMNSTIKVDNKTGWVIESKVIEAVSGTAEIKDNPKVPGGLIIPMSIDTEMTYGSK